jgi:hypothetical protein
MGSRLWFAMLVVVLLVLGDASGYWQQSASAARTARRGYAIRAVLASRQGSEFHYFPHSVGTVRCAIPFGFRTVKGTCSARVAPLPGNSGQVIVNLSERWPWRVFHYTGTPRGPLHHHWVFDLLPSGKIMLARQTGDFPPNYAR